MKDLEEWAADVLARRPRTLNAEIRVEGSRQAHLGPKLESARVEFVVEPAENFSTSIEVHGVSPHESMFVRAAIIGFLDVVLLAEQPIRNIRLRVVAMEVDPIDSSVMAFRRAGRDAGEHLLQAVHK